MKYFGHEAVEFTLHSVRLTTSTCGSRSFSEREYVFDVRAGGQFLGQFTVHEDEYELFLERMTRASNV